MSRIGKFFIFSLVLLCLLNACGGGGDSPESKKGFWDEMRWDEHHWQ